MKITTGALIQLLAQGTVQNILPRNRFQQIKHCLMIANPTPAENVSDQSTTTTLSDGGMEISVK